MDLDAPWNQNIRGEQVLPLINVDAPVIRVEAGPGAGKTFGLARRVHRLVSPGGAGVPPAEVLVVAFNRVIAKDLGHSMETVAAGLETEERVAVNTVHGLCRSQVGDGTGRLLLDHEREMMVYDCAEMDHEVAKTYRTYHERAQALRDHEAGHQDHSRLWQVSQRWLVRHNAHLVGDLPGQMLEAIKNGDLDELRYRHVIVDEFQDLSSVEQQLVASLRTSDGCLLALGDPRQSIYAFRGNNREGLSALESLTDASVLDIPLTECQRCPDEIVGAANDLMRLDPAAPMVPVSTKQARVVQVHWKSPQAEAQGMAQVLRTAFESRPGDRHLVMVTRRRFGYELRAAIKELDSDFPIRLDFSESVLEDWPAREAFLWFCLLADPDPATWRSWLGHRSPTQDDPKFKPPTRNSAPYINWLDGLDGPATHDSVLALAAAGAATLSGSGREILWERACRYRDILESQDWHGMSATQLIDSAFATDLWATAATEVDWSDLALLRKHATEVLLAIEDYSDPDRRAGALKEVADDLRYAIATKEPLGQETIGGVQITTLWGAKGLTADHVYVLGFCDEALPGARSDEYPGDDEAFVEEQRRLLYVTLTRSTESLVLSRASSVTGRENKALNLNSSRRHFMYRWKLTSSRFTRDIGTYLPTSIAGEDWNGDLLG